MKLSDFLIDFIKRLFAKTPKFFVYLRAIGVILAAAVKLPDWLGQIGIHVPVTEDPYKTIVAISGIALAFVSQLTVADDSRIKPTLNIKQ